MPRSKSDPSNHPRLLLTSFATWLPHQHTNSSDDLVAEILTMPGFAGQLHPLRRLPVDFERASQLAIAQVSHLQPQGVILCGMAETRHHLSVEVQAVGEQDALLTSSDVTTLIEGLEHTRASTDAGRFVCNRLYYDMLWHLRDRPCPCVFVHVPRLTQDNRANIVSDFCELLTRFLRSTAGRCPAPHA